MIKKRIKKISKLLILISIRQVWKLLANIYHLVTQPFVTIKLLIKERDKSQIFLLSLFAISPIIIYATARIIWDNLKYGYILNSVGGVFAVVLLVEIFVFAYLCYWLYLIFRRK